MRTMESNKGGREELSSSTKTRRSGSEHPGTGQGCGERTQQWQNQNRDEEFGD